MDLGEIGQLQLEKSIDDTKEKDIGETEAVTEKQVIEEALEEKEILLGPYLGQYVIYTGPIYAWLLW